MAVKSVEQINKELGSIYDPQVQSIQQRKALIPQQLQAEESGLQAKQTQAYDEILGGARRRGLGFSGIPLGEQAKYNSTEYMPALARLRQGAREQEMSLADAIMKINQDRFGMANQLQRYSVEDDRWERQFAEDRRRYEQQLAEARRSAAAAARGSGGFSLGGGGFGAGGQTGAAPAKNDPYAEKAWHNIMNVFGGTNDLTQVNPDALRSDYFATARSAQRGNKIDLMKLKLYRQARPDLFKVPYSWESSGAKYGTIKGASY